MHFLTFILKNVRRRMVRSLLTVTAIAIAVGAVVALVGIAVGFKTTFLELYSKVGVDLLVVKSRVGRQLESGIDESMCQRIAEIPGVQSAIPGLTDVVSFPEEDLYMVVVNGLVPDTVVFEHLQIVSGRALRTDDQRAVMLGTILATNLHKTVGDEVEIYEGEKFTVVGIYDSFNVLESGAMIVPMKELQPLMGREGQVLGISVITEDPNDQQLINRVRTEIEQLESGIMARPTREHVSSLTEIQLANAMAWLTSAVALVIGAVGVMNTMIMSVQERTREIGILRAIGWRRWRVMWMVLLESLVLSLLGAAVGTVGAVVLVRILTRLPAVNGLISGDLQLVVVLQGFLIATLVGLIGGLVPALTAARMQPTVALRHE